MMLNPNAMQSLSRIVSTTLVDAVKHVIPSSFGCTIQFRHPNSTFTQVNHHGRAPVIDPTIIKSIHPAELSMLAQSFKNVEPKRRLEAYISPGMFNKITFRLPGLHQLQDMYTVPLGYNGRLPLQTSLPPIIIHEKLDPNPSVEIREPSTIQSSQEKLAAVLVQIRKKKMRKHRLKKLHKRMFFAWQRIKQRRRARVEKHFIGCQLDRIKAAEDFHAEEWVKTYLMKSTTDPKTLIVQKPKLPRPTKYVF